MPLSHAVRRDALVPLALTLLLLAGCGDDSSGDGEAVRGDVEEWLSAVCGDATVDEAPDPEPAWFDEVPVQLELSCDAESGDTVTARVVDDDPTDDLDSVGADIESGDGEKFEYAVREAGDGWVAVTTTPAGASMNDPLTVLTPLEDQGFELGGNGIDRD